MSKFVLFNRTRITSCLISIVLLYLSSAGLSTLAQAPAASASSQAAAGTPSDVVRAFYKALRERHFREAFEMSVFKPAIEGLSASEFEELQPDFEKIAAGVPENIELSGEQISGDTATVFIKGVGDEAGQLEPVTLLREGGAWIVGDKESEAAVRRDGKQFFLKTRIETHHKEVQAMLLRIANAELAYSVQHGGLYADLPALVEAKLVPQDLETTESTGYRFHITVGKDGKSYMAGAEPARYNHTGRLSFYMDQTGLRSKDNGGKPLSASSAKK